MVLIRMASAVRRPKIAATLGIMGLLAAGSVVGVVGVVGTASAADRWASHNLYCYAATGANSSREFIRSVGYTDATSTFDYVQEHQEWRDGSYARADATSKSLDASNIGGVGVLSAFEDGGDPGWACKQFAGAGSWTGVLTTDS